MSTYDDRQRGRIARTVTNSQAPTCGSIGQHKRLMRRAKRVGAPDLGSRNCPPAIKEQNA